MSSVPVRYLIYSTIVTILFFSSIEATQRLRLYYRDGKNPQWLYWGNYFREKWDHRDGYKKFGPNTTVNIGTISFRTNSLGLRGPEFSPRKPDGTVRVVALGASSTMGSFGSTTYPGLLQERLNSTLNFAGKRYEVINAGIPGHQTWHLVKFLKREIAHWSPDWIILYAGYNNIATLGPSVLERLKNWLMRESVFFLTLQEKLEVMVGRNVALASSPLYPIYKDRLLALRREARDKYISDVQEIIDVCKSRGIRLLLVSQPISMKFYTASKFVEDSERRARYEKYKPLVSFLRSALDREGWIWKFESRLLLHAGLMEALRELATKSGLPFVDFIAVADSHTGVLEDKVHPGDKGNRLLADTVFEELRNHL